MSDFLSEKILYSNDVKKLNNSLQKINALRWMRFITEPPARIQPSEIWQSINRYDADFTMRIEYDKPYNVIFNHLHSYIDEANIKNNFLLAVGGSSLPWSELSILDEKVWIEQLWKELINKDFILLSVDFENIVAVIEEESYFQIIAGMTRDFVSISQ